VAGLKQVPGFAPKKTDGFNVVFQAFQAQAHYLLRSRGYDK